MINDSALMAEEKKPSQLLDFVRELHASLNASDIIHHFAFELKKHLAYDSITYRNLAMHAHYHRGHDELHSLSYHLSIDSTELGEIRFTRRQPFTDAEIIYLEELLCYIVTPLKNAIIHYQALQTALHDPLTQLLNRGSLDKTLTREIQLAERHETPFSIVILDIDNFKLINDTYGHLTGDEIIKLTADTIKSTIRDTDLAFRIGGEEFLLLLSNTSPDGAFELGERLRQAIAQSDYNHHGKVINYTTSVGIANFQDKDTVQSLIARADKGLYQAKSSGKNQTHVCFED